MSQRLTAIASTLCDLYLKVNILLTSRFLTIYFSAREFVRWSHRDIIVETGLGAKGGSWPFVFLPSRDIAATNA